MSEGGDGSDPESALGQVVGAPAEGSSPRGAHSTKPVGLSEIFFAFLKLGATSFGGGVVAYLREELVVRERWLDDATFLAGLELSQTLPGLNATNMSVYVGERLRGAPGAVVACLGMMLPGTAVVMLLGVLLAGHGHLPDVSVVLGGVGAAAVGLLLATTWKIARPVVEGVGDVALAVVTFVAIGVFHVSLVLVLVTIGPVAVLIHRPRDGARDASPGDRTGPPGCGGIEPGARR